MKKQNEVMFIFCAKNQVSKQVKPQKQGLNRLIRLLKQITDPNNKNNTIVCCSNLKSYYDNVRHKLAGQWAQFNLKYENEIIKNKKRQSSWNYSDIRIVRSCIKKSIEQEALSILTEQWCSSAQKILFSPLLQIDLSNNVSKQDLCQKKGKYIHQQMKFFSSFLFHCAFIIYEKFFFMHYLIKSKSEINFTIQEIYHKQKLVFETFVLNCITGTESFRRLYHKCFIKILKSQFPKQKLENNLQEQFQKFVSQQLKIKQKFANIYKKSVMTLWDFHLQCKLQDKIEKACKILTSIQQDHTYYFTKMHINSLKRQQTVSAPLLIYLFKFYCPQIMVSFQYIKLLVCNQLDYSEIDANFLNAFFEYCYLWLNESYDSKFKVIFNAANAM